MDDELRSVLGQILMVVETTRTDVADLKIGQNALRADVTALQEGQNALRADVTALQEGQNALRADVTTLQEGQNALRSDLEQLRHVTSANHLKLSGKVELVVNMLADHIADYHGPGDRRRA